MSNRFEYTLYQGKKIHSPKAHEKMLKIMRVSLGNCKLKPQNDTTTPIGMAKMKKTKCWQGYEALALLYNADENFK